MAKNIKVSADDESQKQEVQLNSDEFFENDDQSNENDVQTNDDEQSNDDHPNENDDHNKENDEVNDDNNDQVKIEEFKKISEQAGTELGQAQLKLGLGFTSTIDS